MTTGPWAFPLIPYDLQRLAAESGQPTGFGFTFFGFGVFVYIVSRYLIGNRSQVQGSTFRVKDKGGIEDLKSSSKMLIFPNNCQFVAKFWI